MKKIVKDPNRQSKHIIERKINLANYLGIKNEKFKAIDHHKAHAYYSYYTSNMIGKNVLSLLLML